MGRPIRVYGHRGFRARYPENTLLAFRKAFEAGAVGIECDVQKTGDGRFVVIHDETVLATTGKEGRVAELTLARLKHLDAGTGERIPELGELLETIPPGNEINIELKKETVSPDDCPAIHELIVSRIEAQRCLISSFNHELLPYFRERGMKTGILIGEEHQALGIMGLIGLIRRYRPDYLNLPVQVYEKISPVIFNVILRLLKCTGLSVAFWTVNTAREFAAARSVVDVIITDQVELMISLTRKE